MYNNCIYIPIYILYTSIYIPIYILYNYIYIYISNICAIYKPYARHKSYMGYTKKCRYTIFLKLTMPGTYPITIGKLLELIRLRIFMLDISLAGWFDIARGTSCGDFRHLNSHKNWGFTQQKWDNEGQMNG